MTDTTAQPRLLNDRYRLVRTLRADARYEVHRVRDVLLDRDVIAKVRTYTVDEHGDRRRNEAVARLMASVTHHGLVPVLDYDVRPTADGGARMLLIMEAARGRTLRRRLVEAVPLTTRQAAELGYDLAEALEHLHEHGVLHRGLTPSTVFLVEQETGALRAQIADLTAAVRTDVGPVTPSDAAGLWAYRSPEELRGEPASPASDVYQLGLVVLEALTGRAAFRDPQQRVEHPDVAPPIPSAIPPGLAEPLRRATATDPRERPLPTELAAAFRRVVAAETGRNRRIDPTLRSAEQEEARLAALHQYDLLDTPPEGAFDRITTLAARVFDMPVSTVSIVDRDRIWFKSHFGLDGGEIARDPGLCATVVDTGERVVIADARTDSGAQHNPLIAGDLGLQSYAGVPLTSIDGFTLGALSVADYRPRTLSADQLDILERLGRMITHELEMRLATRRAVLSRE
ncbi:GAF domain-containing protein [uncultured Amnibacterium sp.]|uniref:protein kinase domain-containing protein n=1 Tax=uncultured Amnibacterium sp. TaxID=1631851 RepID=UPI0035CB05D1